MVSTVDLKKKEMFKINRPLLSIIVPVYNVESYLEECLLSLESTKKLDYEVILINDGSTDDSVKICEFFCEKNKNFKLISKINEGLSATRNLGIDLSKGKYVTFIDSDDYIEFDILNKLLIYAENNDLDIMRGTYKKFDGEEIVFQNKYLDKIEIEKFENNLMYLRKSLRNNRYEIVTCTSIYKRDFLIKNNLYFKKSLFFEDHEFTFKALLITNSKIGESINIPYYYYRQRKGSITKSIDYSKIMSFLEIMKLQKKYITDISSKELKKIAYELMLITIDHFIQFCEYNLKVNEKNEIRNKFKKIITKKEILNFFFLNDSKRKLKLSFFVFFPEISNLLYLNKK